MKRLFIITQPALIILTSLFLNFCGGIGGGGGGGGSASAPDPAHVSIDVNPATIDSGDRTAVTVDIRDVNDLGIALKLRYPTGLNYVTGSAQIDVDGTSFTAIPESKEQTSGKLTYLVFYFSKSVFGDNSGTITLFLQGNGAVDSVIEVDADLDNPSIKNSTEFEIADPKFDAQDAANIVVKDSSATGTASPTASATP